MFNKLRFALLANFLCILSSNLNLQRRKYISLDNLLFVQLLLRYANRQTMFSFVKLYIKFEESSLLYYPIYKKPK